MTWLARFAGASPSRHLGGRWQFALMAIASILPAGPASGGVTIVDVDDEVSMPHTTYLMTVTPARESIPAMKHRLLPRRIELQGGNAGPLYRRSLENRPDLPRPTEETSGEEIPLAEWTKLTTPLDQLPLDEVRSHLAAYDGCMPDLAAAVVQRHCDWQLQYEDARGMQLVDFDFSVIQECRELMRMLAVRTRLAVAEGRYDDAIAYARMNMKLSLDVAHERHVICGLVGNAGIGLVNDGLIDLIGAPGSPNLYWALASLPRPVTSLQEHAQSDLELGLRMFEVFEKAETADWTHEEWNDRFKKACAELMTFSEDPTAPASDSWAATQRTLTAKLTAPVVGVAGYRHAKARLRELGFDAARLEVMPVGQVMAIYTARAYQRFVDEFEKQLSMPFQDAMNFDPNAIEDQFFPLSDFEDREFLPLAKILSPIAVPAMNSQMRITRDIATLQVIEALRMHAADNDGRWPASLDEITCVPVPENPATGEPFEYRLEGDAATLELPAEDRVVSSRRFVLRIADEESP